MAGLDELQRDLDATGHSIKNIADAVDPQDVPSYAQLLAGGGGGMSATTHKTLRQLIHLADGGGPFEGFTSLAYRETTPSGAVFPTAVIWWTDSGKTMKIVQKLITWTGSTPTTIEWKAYDTDGTTVLATVSDAISYSGMIETDRTRTIT
jgi:hypothetical protein